MKAMGQCTVATMFMGARYLQDYQGSLPSPPQPVALLAAT